MFIIDRLREPSTWASIAAMLVGVGVSVPGDLVQPLSFVLAGVAGVAGFFLREKK